MLNNTVHKNILIQILKDIYSASDLAPVLGFKGGTAVYVFYHLDRFSVDLDFDLLDDSKKDQVVASIQSIIGQYGTVKDARIKRYSLFFLLSYKKDHMNIKIEINLRKFGSQYEVKDYLGVSMFVMAQKDMFAHKLVAMYERMGKANRDIYDVHFFLKHQWPVNEAIIKKRTDLEMPCFIKKLVEPLQTVNQRNILSGMGELLEPKQKIWVKNHLIEDTLFLLRSRWG